VSVTYPLTGSIVPLTRRECMEKDRKGNAHCHWENGTEEGHAGSIVFVIHHDFGMLNVAEGRGKESAIANLGTLSQNRWWHWPQKKKNKTNSTQHVGFRLSER
jgi:hypothetical protein